MNLTIQEVKDNWKVIKARILIDHIGHKYDPVLKLLPWNKAMDLAPIIDAPGLIERCMPEVKGVDYVFINEPYKDYSDGSDCKTGIVNVKIRKNGNVNSSVTIRNVAKKTGYIRAVVVNPYTKFLEDQVSYFFIPPENDLGNCEKGDGSDTRNCRFTYSNVNCNYCKGEQYRVENFEELARAKPKSVRTTYVDFVGLPLDQILV